MDKQYNQIRSSFAAEAKSVPEAVEETQWFRHVLAEMKRSVPCSLPRSLKTVEVDSARQPTVMLRQVFCGAQRAALALVTTATMFADS